MNKDSYLNFFYYLFGFKKINKLFYLLLIVIAHLICWFIFFSLPLFFFRIEITHSIFWYKEFINKLFLVGFFYFNYFLLIPRFFIKGKRLTYLGILLLSILFLFAEQVLVEKKFFEKFPRHSHAPFRTVGFKDSPPFNSSGIIFISRDSVKPGAFFPAPRMRNERTIMSLPGRIFFMILTNVISSVFVLLLLGAFIYLLYFFIKKSDCDN